MKDDIIIVGTGFAGAVTARVLAEKYGKRVLLLEQRDHIGGNAYDCEDEYGVLIHQYGPHIFHTNKQNVFEYLSRFTEWNGYQHEVLASVYGKMMPVPFNLNSLRAAFDGETAARLEKKLIDTYGRETKVSILDLMKNEDAELHALADYVYKNVFLTYTIKQWGMSPEEIDPNTTKRVPVFVSTDNRYFQDAYQGLPSKGYTALFEHMLDHPNITVRLSCPASDVLSFENGVVKAEGEPFDGAVVYTGAPDELFGCCFGPLPYRTLDFAFEHSDKGQYQPTGTVNYTVDQPYTRITEFKHMTLQKISSTSIIKEYSKAYTDREHEIPYYAIINDNNTALYGKYRELASGYKGLYLLGRLAEYQYFNMDVVCEHAMQLADRIGEINQ